MKYSARFSPPHRGMPGGNPIANALVVLVGAFAIGASIVLGFFAFLVLGSVMLVLGAGIALRVWWLNRKLRQAMETHPSPRETGEGGVIEGEFHVIDDREEPPESR